MTNSRLHHAEARYRRAVERAHEAREVRDKAIREALAAGMSGQQISKATGLSRGRISQLKTSD